MRFELKSSETWALLGEGSHSSANKDFHLLGWHDVDWYMGTSISKEPAASKCFTPIY
jgi:hypothetical protein